MTTPPILDLTTSTPSIQQEIITTLVLLEADPLVSNLATPLETFYQQRWRPAVVQETELLIEEVRADALVDAADHALDDFVDEFDAVLLRVVGKDRNDPLYAFYFGKKRPFELKRPVLGGQLEMMRDFVQPLKTASQTELAELGIKLEGLVNTADAAVKRQQAAVTANKTFRTLGERKSCIDELNALRQSIAGTLSEMPHKHPEKRLPVDYAERFFKRSARRGKSSKEFTVAELEVKISEQEQVLAALKVQLAEAVAKSEAEAMAKAEKEALRGELEIAQKAAIEANARIAAIKAKLT
jgi:uncharacterized coiled-coil protein SlyX